MRLKNLKAVLLHVLMLATLVFSSVSALHAQTPNKPDEATQKVKTLFDQGKFGEAVPYLEILVKDDPEDADLRFLYGFALLAKSKSVADAAIAKQISTQARAEFIKAKELGAKEKVLDELIAMLSEGGNGNGASNVAPVQKESNYFSKNQEAENLMHQAESYFARADYDKAFELYQKALKLDPGIYEAALFSGDVFLQKGNFKDAETWYQKAIVINPNRETAYRYSATPLMKQGKYEQARERYIEAYITEPYSDLARRGLVQWGQVTKTRLSHPKIDIPANVGTGANGNININLGISDDDGDGSFAWTAYGLARAGWQSGKSGLSDKFKKSYPNEKEYRHSLAEEFDALKMTVSVLKERMKDKDSPVKKLSPQLQTLIEIYDDGLLEAFVLLSMPDKGIVKDHPEYLKQNRAKLRQYVAKYVISTDN